MISRKIITEECEGLMASINRKKKMIEKAPEGRLECHKEKNYWNHYAVQVKTDDEGHKKVTRQYIKKNDDLARLLAEKAVHINSIRDEEQELRALKLYLNNCSKFERVNNYINKTEEHSRLTQHMFDHKWPNEVQAWLDNDNSEKYHPEGLKYRCRNGMHVRSKSEQLIVAALCYHNIPFKYEQTITLDGITLRPDFTLLNMRNGREYLWEHFGMMSDNYYRVACSRKLSTYFNSGYIPYENLIATFESDDGGIDEVWIDSIIENFLK